MTPTAGSEELDHAECYRLLGSVPLGRVVGTANALPMVLPVNFALDGGSVLIRTTPHSAVAAVAVGVAFVPNVTARPPARGRTGIKRESPGAGSSPR